MEISIKRFFSCIFMLSLAYCLSTTNIVLADDGELGTFGGITEGVSLPKTTELMLEKTSSSKKKESHELQYKEMVFLSGKPEVFEGIMTIDTNGSVEDDKDVGTYKVTYTVEPLDNAADSAPSIVREISFDVNYRKVTTGGSNQVIKDYVVKEWTEAITAGGGTYTINEKQSHIERSIIQDNTPGVDYYKGTVSKIAVYSTGEDAGSNLRVEESGSIYGYVSAWSKTETSRLDVTVSNNAADWQLEAQVRPSVSVAKNLQYSPNEPTAISFDGNYYEVITNNSVLSYNIYIAPKIYERDTTSTGSFNIPTINKFEQLAAPDLAFLKGHFAESDIKKLFAMQVLDGEPKQFQPNQAMTRGQFISAIVKAAKIPVEDPNAKKKSSKKTVVSVLFPDVQSNRLDFNYIMAAYKVGLAIGRFDTTYENYYRPDEAITREEAITVLVRALGLENLGLDPTPITSFTDDRKISSWAKREISAAQAIDIIYGDADGNFNPQKKISKAEGAAFINRMIEYMRKDLPIDYVEHILNYSK